MTLLELAKSVRFCLVQRLIYQVIDIRSSISSSAKSGSEKILQAASWDLRSYFASLYFSKEVSSLL